MLTEKPLWISSNANIIPASGAWNAAASPALAPHVIRYFSSVFPLSSSRETPCPVIAPSWMDGPSLPSDSPPRRQRKPPRNFAGRTRFHFSLSFPWISPSTWGMPLPDIMGSHLTSFPTIRASSTSTANHPAVRSGSPSINASTLFSASPANVSASRYSRTTSPPAAPTRSPSPIRMTGSLRALFIV